MQNCSMLHPSPQHAGQQQQQAPPQAQQPSQQQKDDKADNITKVKALLSPLRESLFHSLRAAAFTLQQNTLADTLKKDTIGSTASMRFDKHLEDFFAHCDQIELHLKTAIQCMQQISSAQHYLPRLEPYLQEMTPSGHLPYQSYLNTARIHVQSAKDIHDTLISAAQNISQAD